MEGRGLLIVVTVRTFSAEDESSDEHFVTIGGVVVELQGDEQCGESDHGQTGVAGELGQSETVQVEPEPEHEHDAEDPGHSEGGEYDVPRVSMSAFY